VAPPVAHAVAWHEAVVAIPSPRPHAVPLAPPHRRRPPPRPPARITSPAHTAPAPRERAHVVRHRVATAKPAAPPARGTPVASLSHAADRVIEVVPGAIVRALAGLAGLVLLLVIRSWAMERRRATAL